MSSIREQIWVAALAALNTSRPAGVPAVARLLASNVEPADLPDGVLVPGPENAKRVGGLSGALTEKSCTFWIYWRSAGDGTTGPDQKLDPMLNWGEKQLNGNTFGGLALDTEYTGIKDWEFKPGERFFGRALQQFEVHYTTRVKDAELRT